MLLLIVSGYTEDIILTSSYVIQFSLIVIRWQAVLPEMFCSTMICYVAC